MPTPPNIDPRMETDTIGALSNGGFNASSNGPTPATVNLMRLYKEIARSEVRCNKHTIECIYKLADHHLALQNYCEAGFALKIHADRLAWVWDSVPGDAFGSLNNENRSHQFEWQLKESLYMTIIEYFDRGKCWEEAIGIMKDLANFYEKIIFDYAKWSSILKMHATFLDNILNQFRPESEYFRVGFYGSGFPAFLRNKVFIYRGLEFEKIANFTERLQTEFPAASLITKSGPPDESILERDGQFMQIISVKPCQDPRPEFDGKDVPDKVLTYFLTNNVKTFVSDRPLHKGPVDRENEFKSLWIERSTLITNEKLPGILRWSEVVSKKLTELSPLEHACETVENMNRELQKLIVSYSQDPTKAISPLSMRLQGVIEAAVNGGVAKYQDAFFNPKYIHLHPEQGPYIRRLKQLILQKVRILEGGLSLHGRLAPVNIQPLQRRLLERLTLMRHNVMEASANVMDSSLDTMPLRRNPSIIHTPLPPIPVGGPMVDGRETQSLPVLINGRINGDTYTLPMKEQNGNVTNNNNNYHDVIYAVPGDRSANNESEVDGHQPQRSSDPAAPPPLPPKRPKRPRSSGMSVSLDMTSPTTPETPPPRPPMPAVNSPLSLSHETSQDQERSQQRNRTIPRSNHSFQLSQLSSNETSNGNLYTPSPTRIPLKPELVSPDIPPRVLFPSIDRNSITSAKSPASQPQSSPVVNPNADFKPALPPKTVRKTISSNQLDLPPPPDLLRQSMTNPSLSGHLMTSSSGVSVVTVNGSNSSLNHKTSTLPNRRPPPPTPPLERGSSSPPPPHHPPPPPPAPALSSSEEVELLSMSLVSNMSVLDQDDSFTFISPSPSSASMASSSSATTTTSRLIPTAVSVISVNASSPSVMAPCAQSQKDTTTIIRVNSNDVRKSNQSTESAESSSSSSESSAADVGIQGV